jgi:N6-adenosine-specific RNA methylase IME4
MVTTCQKNQKTPQTIATRPRPQTFHRVLATILLLVDKEFRDLIRPLKSAECALLEKSIVREGCRDPIVVWRGHNIILDGHNRYDICRKHGIPFKVVYLDFPSRQAAKQWIVENQLAKRNLTPYQRALLALELERVIAAEARKQQGRRIDISPTLANSCQAIDAREEAARRTGLSHGTISKVKLIVEEGTEEEKEKLSSGDPKLSIHAVYLRILQRKIRTETPPFPRDKFSLVYADPPWSFEFVPAENRAVQNHYPTMSFEQLSLLPVWSIAEDNCVLAMWAPACKLDEALRLIKAWGFTYRTCAVWTKDKLGLGYYFRNQHELLLIAIKGEPATPKPEDRSSSVINAPRTIHSEKPDQAYEILERMYPDFRRIELFARKTRPGWAAWGNQLPQPIQIRVEASRR